MATEAVSPLTEHRLCPQPRRRCLASPRLVSLSHRRGNSPTDHHARTPLLSLRSPAPTVTPFSFSWPGRWLTRRGTSQAPVKLHGLDGRYATSLWKVASEKGELDKVEKDLGSFGVSVCLH